MDRGADPVIRPETSPTLGHVISDVAEAFPETHFTVLSGHTHGRGRKQLRSNLLCISGKAVYGNPKLAEVLHFG